MKTAGFAALAVLYIAACASQSTAEAGRDLFVTHCSNCHGVFAAGDGPISQDLSLALRDLRRIRDDDGRFPRELIRQIIDGRQGHSPPDMPEWGEVFGSDADANIDAIVAYLHAIQQAD